MKKKNPGITRRSFISRTATGLASMGLAGLPVGMVLAEETAQSPAAATGDILYRQLGRTSLRMPIIGMGVMNADNPELVQASYDLGVRHFDTAATYQFGRNEQMVGSVINRLGVRDKVSIATKMFSPSQRRGLTPEATRAKLVKDTEASLRRLGTEYVDILFVHDVASAETVQDQAIIDALAKLKEQKKITAAGISTHSQMAEVINAAAAGGFYDVVLTSINFTMADDTTLRDAVANAHARGMGVVAMKTQAGGGRWPDPESRRNYSSETIATAALKWVLRNEHITMAIPGYTTYEQMRLDFTVARDLEYTDQEQAFLADNRATLGIGFCRQCGTCLAACPRGVDVPTLMRTHMYAAQYANFHQARVTLDEIPRQKGLQACKSCAGCAVRCANAVDIARRISELKLIYA